MTDVRGIVVDCADVTETTTVCVVCASDVTVGWPTVVGKDSVTDVLGIVVDCADVTETTTVCVVCMSDVTEGLLDVVGKDSVTDWVTCIVSWIILTNGNITTNV